MTDLGYLIWFIAMAIMTIFVLTIGTLAAAGMLTREKSDEDTGLRAQADEQPEIPEQPQHAA